jgi:CheY-like chemotaxis protein
MNSIEAAERLRSGTYWIGGALIMEKVARQRNARAEAAAAKAIRNTLIVDDEPEICSLLRDVLTRAGYHVSTASGGEEAVRMVAEQPYDAVFLDIKMPKLDGAQTLKVLRELRADLRVVMMTGFARDEALEQAMDLGAFACLPKPVSVRDVLNVVSLLEGV